MVSECPISILPLLHSFSEKTCKLSSTASITIYEYIKSTLLSCEQKICMKLGVEVQSAREVLNIYNLIIQEF